MTDGTPPRLRGPITDVQDIGARALVLLVLVCLLPVGAGLAAGVVIHGSVTAQTSGGYLGLLMLTGVLVLSAFVAGLHAFFTWVLDEFLEPAALPRAEAQGMTLVLVFGTGLSAGMLLSLATSLPWAGATWWLTAIVVASPVVVGLYGTVLVARERRRRRPPAVRAGIT